MKNVRRITTRGLLLVGLSGVIVLLVVECSKPDSEALGFGLRTAEVFHKEFNDLREADFSDDPIDRDQEVIRSSNGSFSFAGYLRSARVQDARTKLGRLKSAYLKDYATSHSKVGIFVKLTFACQFDHNAATERIIFLVNPDIAPDSAAMTFYDIESSALQRQPGF